MKPTQELQDKAGLGQTVLHTSAPPKGTTV